MSNEKAKQTPLNGNARINIAYKHSTRRRRRIQTFS